MYSQDELDKWNAWLTTTAGIPTLLKSLDELIPQIPECNELNIRHSEPLKDRCSAASRSTRNGLATLQEQSSSIEDLNLIPNQIIGELLICVFTSQLVIQTLRRRLQEIKRRPCTGFWRSNRLKSLTNVIARLVVTLTAICDGIDDLLDRSQSLKLLSPKTVPLYYRPSLFHDIDGLLFPQRSVVRRIWSYVRLRHVEIHDLRDVHRYLNDLCGHIYTSPRVPRLKAIDNILRISERYRAHRIEKRLRFDEQITHNTLKGAVFWAGGCDKERILADIELHGTDGDTKTIEYRPRIWTFVVTCAQHLVGLVNKDPYATKFQPLHDTIAIIKRHTADSLPNQEFRSALRTLWSSPEMTWLRTTADHSELYRHPHEATAYFLDSATRITSPDYRPTPEDIYQIKRSRPFGWQPANFRLDNLIIELSILGPTQGERRKWIHHVSDFPIVMFVLDLTTYDEVLHEDTTISRLSETKVLFESIVNSRLLRPTSAILVLDQVDRFAQKLACSPLERLFKEYHGGSNVRAALQFILDFFLATNRGTNPIYPVVAQSHSTSCSQAVFAVCRQIALRRRVAGD